MNAKSTICCLSGNALKIIAMISMLIDHIGYYLFPRVLVLRAIGRIAFPIFAFMIAEGCAHTRNRKRYFWMIAGLGGFCQVFTLLLKHSLHLNVLITFSCSISIVYCIDAWIRAERKRTRILSSIALAVIVFATIVFPRLFPQYGYTFEYDFLGILLPVALYYLPKKSYRLIYLAATIVAMILQWGVWVRPFGLLAIPLLALYSGKRGKAQLKYLFYIFYPVHLAVLYLVAVFFLA